MGRVNYRRDYQRDRVPLFLLAALLAALVALAWPTTAPAREAPATTVEAHVAALERSLVRVHVDVYRGDLRVGEGRATAFADGPRSFLTARHNVDPATITTGRLTGLRAANPRIVYKDDSEATVTRIEVLYGDAARVWVEKPHGLPPLVMADDILGEGPVEIIGYPEGQAPGTFVRCAGELSTMPMQAHPEVPAWIHFRSPVAVGMSGSPVLYRGKVVGIVVATARTKGFAALCDRVTLAALASGK